MKQLFLMRHGHAEFYAQTDALRPLSEKGHYEAAAIGLQLAKLQVSCNQVWVSPYLRAQQTWAQLQQSLTVNGNSKGLSPAPQVLTQAAITPEGQVHEVVRLLNEAFNQNATDRLLCVTHQPLVGDLLEYLCGCERGRYFMNTAHIASLVIPTASDGSAIVAAGLCELQWIKQPASND